MVGSDAVVSNSKVEEGRLCEPKRSAIAARPRKAHHSKRGNVAYGMVGNRGGGSARRARRNLVTEEIRPMYCP